jgi:hypothetical protein
VRCGLGHGGAGTWVDNHKDYFSKITNKKLIICFNGKGIRVVSLENPTAKPFVFPLFNLWIIPLKPP